MKKLIICGLAAAMLTLCTNHAEIYGNKGQQEKPKEEVLYTGFFHTDKMLQTMMDEAENLAAKGRRTEAVLRYRDSLQYALDMAPDAMQPLSDTPEDGMTRYMPCSSYCLGKILEADAATLAEYRDSVEHIAAKKFKQASLRHNGAAFIEIGRRYPMTKSGTAATVAAGDIARENCDYLRASHCYTIARRAHAALLQTGYTTRSEYAALIAKAAWVFGERNDKAGLLNIKATLDEDEKLARTRTTIEREPIEISKIVDEALAAIKPEKPLPEGDYPTFGGRNSRGMMQADPPAGLNAVAWRHEVEHKPAQENLYFGDYEKMHISLRKAFLTPEPILHDGRLLVNTGHSLMTMNAADGSAVFGGKLTVAETEKRFVSNIKPAEFCAVRDGKIFLSVHARMQIGCMIHQERAIAALDAKTGKILWHSKDSGMLPNEAACTAPVVAGDNVIFASWTRGKDNNHFYMLCLDAKNGKMKWRRKLAGAVNYENKGASDIIALSGNTAVLASSCGAIFGIDISYGEIKWAVKYDLDYSRCYRDLKIPTTRLARYWCVNSPVIVNDCAIFSPLFSERLLCLELASGRTRWTLDLPRFDYIAGIDGDRLFIVNDDVLEYDIPSGKIVRRSPLSIPAPDTPIEDIPAPAGRPALTKNALYISTQKGLYRYDRKTRETSKILDWAKYNMQPGNLLCSKDRLFVVNFNEIVALAASTSPTGEEAAPTGVSSGR